MTLEILYEQGWRQQVEYALLEVKLQSIAGRAYSVVATAMTGSHLRVPEIQQNLLWPAVAIARKCLVSAEEDAW
ncbi:hypothetical protein [Rubellimicrobium roseum]|uniref:Uncharacterized protein n=1 Tax=Rubellimicrobium roseum TaxID=687525 RepID=A0A5C4NKC0_9RHOB|nr:hypothetical protein [Rubellimicrobium roseum]TNC74335.1 hypothetical protein FHG71_03920 [Rubellimicrobium roseum]